MPLSALAVHEIVSTRGALDKHWPVSLCLDFKSFLLSVFDYLHINVRFGRWVGSFIEFGDFQSCHFAVQFLWAKD